MVVAQATPLWSLVWGKPQVDPANLARAVSEEARKPELDYRTRCLMRESIQALRDYWGDEPVETWLRRDPHEARLRSLFLETDDKPGFPSLRQRLMEKTDPETVRAFLRELGTRIGRAPVSLTLGNAIALILTGYLARATEDIDVMDEIPGPIRNRHATLESLQERYGLRLTQFQAHFLPSGWERRVGCPEDYGSLRVRLVDVVDIFLGKLTSARPKDLDDLRALEAAIDKEVLVERLRRTLGPLLATDDDHAQARKNWYILFGEELPS